MNWPLAVLTASTHAPVNPSAVSAKHRPTKGEAVLRRVAVELQQHVGVVDDLGDRLGVLGAVVDLEDLDRKLGVVDVLGVVDLLERRQRARMR